MQELHIVSVGISLLTHYAKAHGGSPADALSLAQDVRAFLDKDPIGASAEIHSLDSRTGFLRGHASELGVSLIYTDTKEGRFTSTLLAKFLSRHNVSPVTPIKLRNISIPAAKTVNPDYATRLALHGLRELREKTLTHIQKMSRQYGNDLRIQINVTGGYKAEIAVLYELGRFLRVPVYYLHETFRAAVEIY